MSQTTQTPTSYSTESKTGGGLATGSLVLGIVTIVVAFMPVINQGVFFTGAIGLILGIIALVKRQRGKSKAIAGTILSTVGMIIAAVVISVLLSALSGVGNAVNEASKSANADLNKEVKVTYKVTSTGPAKANFTSVQGSENAPVNGSWEKEITFTGLKALTISVTPDDYQAKNTLSCEILIDGKSISKKEDTNTVLCSGSTK